jgi:serine/threonine-protein kinase
MSTPAKIKDRYELRTVLGRGGMGTVYRAFDTVFRREVAIKMLRDVNTQLLIDLFYRECSALATLAHSNVVDIFDMGTFEDEGVARPYFVMPLLTGRTLHDLIYPHREPLPLPRCIDIICQASRGLQCAHDHGLLHRDIKPSNIFVMNDDSVQIIDFGVAHFTGNQSTGMKGTLQYMAPEQIGMKPLNSRSDIFSLGVVCYESLTAVQPFWRTREEDVVKAVMQDNPQLASDLHAGVPRAVALVVAKAMAKDPSARFSSASEFANSLQKAWHNEPLRPAPAATVRTRFEFAERSFKERDFQFASEILNELESEGYVNEQVLKLRQDVIQAIREQSTNRLLENAKRCVDEEEYSLALRKIQDILELMPEHPPALELKQRIEDALTEQKISELLRVAAEHLEHMALTSARQVAQDALNLKPDDARAKDLLKNIELKQQDVIRSRREQESLFQAARTAWAAGNLSLAIERFEQEAESIRRAAGRRDWCPEHKEIERKVREERKALQTDLAEARRKLRVGNLSAALSLYERQCARYPDEPLVRSLRQEIESIQRENVDRQVEDLEARLLTEPDLGRQAATVAEALKEHPDEDAFLNLLAQIQAKQKAADAVLELARRHEKSGEYAKALEKWRQLESINPGFPMLAEEMSRLTEICKRREVEAKLSTAHRLFQSNRLSECSQILQQALESARGNTLLERFIFDELNQQAERILHTDWRAAETLVKQAASIRQEWQPPARIRDTIGVMRAEEHRSPAAASVQHQAAPAASGAHIEGAAQIVSESAATTTAREPENVVERLRELQALTDNPANTSYLDDYMKRCRALAWREQPTAEVSRLARAIVEQILALQAARWAFTKGDRRECLRICDQFLKDNPGSASFLMLKSQAQNQIQ